VDNLLEELIVFCGYVTTTCPQASRWASAC